MCQAARSLIGADQSVPRCSSPYFLCWIRFIKILILAIVQGAAELSPVSRFSACHRGWQIARSRPHQSRDDSALSDAAHGYDVRSDFLFLEFLESELLLVTPCILEFCQAGYSRHGVHGFGRI